MIYTKNIDTAVVDVHKDADGMLATVKSHDKRECRMVAFSIIASWSAVGKPYICGGARVNGVHRLNIALKYGWRSNG